MRLLVQFITGAPPEYRAVFHDFAEGLARMLRRRRAVARVRAVDG